MAEDKKVTFGLTEKAAYVLIYLFGWLSGLIFYFSEKDNKTIRLHALQVLIFSAGFCVAMLILGWILGAIAAATLFSGGFAGVIAFTWITSLLWIAYWVVIIIAIVRACNGSILKLPIAYNIAEKKV